MTGSPAGECRILLSQTVKCCTLLLLMGVVGSLSPGVQCTRRVYVATWAEFYLVV